MKPLFPKSIVYFLTVTSLCLLVAITKAKANGPGPKNTSPGKTVMGFLKWYWDNEETISNITLVNTPSGNNDTINTIPFSINTKGTGEYLSILKNSGFVSDAYIKSWKKYFKDYEKVFKDDPQYEGCPAGFDYNFIMQSNDPEEKPASMSKVKISSQSIKGNKATVTVTLPHATKINYTLTKVKGKWLIDNIVATDK